VVQIAVQKYYTFFDETLKSGTFIVLIISTLICLVGAFAPNVNADKIDLNSAWEENRVMIHGVEYQIHFQKIQ